ncbi:MAG: integration host factor subunit beta [Deltaproteobacteria bacterium]|nr:integration host factor subunit beta [Deltaproteobacteria bacterium]MBW1795449.1 integration host factor subunit beta [Deltaproteobacteria bacterium]MBW2329406.1 integration host factor subunit beta [Deltaproteobacteria bacterium]
MTKAGLIEALRKETGLSATKSKQVVELFFDRMSDALAKGDRVEIRGFCSIYVKQYKGYSGRNPKTGEHRHVPPKKLPFFKCGKELKEGVDVPTLMKKTGFEDKKIRNIVFKASKAGEIKRAGRGIYVAA